jgi:hypothetical protein
MLLSFFLVEVTVTNAACIKPRFGVDWREFHLFIFQHLF